MTKEKLHQILDIKESYQLPEKLMRVLSDENEKEKVFDLCMINNDCDLSNDWFQEYYEEEYSERKKLKQDFTPECIGKIISGMSQSFASCCDVCAGIGGLTINMWNLCKTAFFYCEEISAAALPILLFNMAIRNIEGQIVHGDSLSGQIYKIYTLHHAEKYSEIVTDEPKIEKKFDIVVTNPPYSMKWDRDKYIQDKRFEHFGLAPASRADYAFVLHGLSKINENGKVLAILPHGVLFRGSHEGVIRQKLAEKNLINTIVGLPEKLFLNTDIPVVVLELKKEKRDNEILIIDASKKYKKVASKNTIETDDIKNIIKAHEKYVPCEKYCSLVSRKQLEENEYNLNIPRYVDTFEPESPIDILKTISNIHNINNEIKECECKLLKSLENMKGTNKDAAEEHKKVTKMYREYITQKYPQTQKKQDIDGQITFELE